MTMEDVIVFISALAGVVGIVTGVIGIVQAHYAREEAKDANWIAEKANQIARESNQIAERANQISQKTNEIAETANDKAERANQLSKKANEIAESANEKTEEANLIARDQYKLEIQVDQLAWVDPVPKDFIYQKNIIDMTGVAPPADELDVPTYVTREEYIHNFNEKLADEHYIVLKLWMRINCSATINELKISDLWFNVGRPTARLYSNFYYYDDLPYLTSLRPQFVFEDGKLRINDIVSHENSIKVNLSENNNIIVHVILFDCNANDNEITALKDAIKRGDSSIKFDMELTTASGLVLKKEIRTDFIAGKRAGSAELPEA